MTTMTDARALTVAGRLRTALFGIQPVEATLARRGFAATSPEKRHQLEEAGTAFVQGYLLALASGDPVQSARACAGVDPPIRGFAFEGAAMGLALIDLVTSGVPRRFDRFLHGPAVDHYYMALVGAGWALARCPWGFLTFFPRLDAELRPLTIDGAGFHQAFFNPARYTRPESTSLIRKIDERAFDNGIGRALWFITGAQPRLVSRHIKRFPTRRRTDLWAGVGLAAAYLGAATTPELHELATAAGDDAGQFVIGASFAAKARIRAGNLTPDTARASQTFCGVDAHKAADLTDSCLRESRRIGEADVYRTWRQLLTSSIGSGRVGLVLPNRD